MAWVRSSVGAVGAQKTAAGKDDQDGTRLDKRLTLVVAELFFRQSCKMFDASVKNRGLPG